MTDTPPPARILVIDSNAATRAETVRDLRGAGFVTEEADSGASALQLAGNRIDLIVLDANLPDMDSAEACHRLRNQEETAWLPVIQLSAPSTRNALMAEGLRTGADSYLTHPTESVVLIATVQALLFARNADRVRRRANVRFQTIFEFASGGIAILTRDLLFTDVNSAFCQLAGREREALLQVSLGGIVDASFAPQLEAIKLALEAQGHWEGVVPIVQSHGEPRLSEWRIALEADTGKRIAVATDVTDRVHNERERERLLTSERAARAEADRSNQMKDEFLATLSHELKNPLAAILGWAALLRRTPDLPPLVRQGIEAIERNSRVQSHLTSDLLDFAGIQFGKMRLEMRVIDPMAAVESAIETIAPQARSKSIQLELVSRTYGVSVLGDDARLQQVVWNLLTNAIKFTPNNGRVTVAASVDQDWFELAVTDTGKGISPEFLPRLFDRFSQQDVGTSKSFGGLGIGLTIVHHLVTQHHATIEAHSQGPGTGATFKVRIPLTLEPKRASHGPTAALSGVDVLVVEDIDDSRALIARLLTDAGARVRDAATGAAALEMIKTAKPDVLVSDIGMAGMDGYELMRSLRASGYTASTLPAIALTAFVRGEEISVAMGAGFQRHLGKPVNPQLLIEMVAHLHAQARPGTAEVK